MKETVKSQGGHAPETGDMSAADFRRFRHELIDWISDYIERIEDLPVLAQIEPGDLKAQISSQPPQAGEAMEQIIADVDRLIVPALTHGVILLSSPTLQPRPPLLGSLANC